MKRYAYFDNAKVFLVTLVVFAHLIQPLTLQSEFMSTLYILILTFLMPAFIFISGFFARGSSDLSYIAILTRRILIPYLIFQVLYSGYYYVLGKENWLKDLFDPHWSLWFLLSLFFWHLLLIIFKKLPSTLGIVIAFSAGVFVGYFDAIGHYFSLSRTFVYFPFFLIGYWMSIDHLRTIKKKSSRGVAVLILIITTLFIYFTPVIDSDWLLGSKSYVTLKLGIYGGLVRAITYLVSLLTAFCVLRLIPQTSFSFTHFGKRSLYVYLLHGFLIQFFRCHDLFQTNNVSSLLQMIVLALLIVLATANSFVRGCTQPFVELSIGQLKAFFHNKFSFDKELRESANRE